MNDQKKLSTYVYIEPASQDLVNGIEIYILYGACTDEFFLRVYCMLQCVYGEYMIPCKSLPSELPTGSMCIAFATHCGFSTLAKRFLVKIPGAHRVECY